MNAAIVQPRKRTGIVNRRNYATAGNPAGEKNTLSSMTIPDQVMSIEKIIERFVIRGEVFAGTFNPVYTENEQLPDGIEFWDEQDKLEYLRQSKQHSAATMADIVQLQKEAKDK